MCNYINKKYINGKRNKMYLSIVGIIRISETKLILLRKRYL